MADNVCNFHLGGVIYALNEFTKERGFDLVFVLQTGLYNIFSKRIRKSRDIRAGQLRALSREERVNGKKNRLKMKMVENLCSVFFLFLHLLYSVVFMVFL